MSKEQLIIWFNEKQQVISNPIKRHDVRQEITNSLNLGFLPLINQAAEEIHERNKAKGFYDEKRDDATLLMLVVCELSEAVEALRKGKTANLEAYEQAAASGFNSEAFEQYVKDSEADEISDAIIRLLDYCGYKGINIQKHINLKLKYNQTRPHKHGKKF